MGGVGHLLHLFLDGLALGDRALEPAASVEAILFRPTRSGRVGGDFVNRALTYGAMRRDQL